MRAADAAAAAGKGAQALSQMKVRPQVVVGPCSWGDIVKACGRARQTLDASLCSLVCSSTLATTCPGHASSEPERLCLRLQPRHDARVLKGAPARPRGLSPPRCMSVLRSRPREFLNTHSWAHTSRVRSWMNMVLKVALPGEQRWGRCEAGEATDARAAGGSTPGAATT